MFASAMLPLLSVTVILVCSMDPFWARSCFPFTSNQSLTLSYSTVCHCNTQLYIACSVNDAASALSVYSFESCLASLHSWFCHNGLALNPIANLRQ